MRMNSTLAGLSMMILGLSSPVDAAGFEYLREPHRTGSNKSKNLKRATPKVSAPHPAMPEGGWPITRQQRRAADRARGYKLDQTL
jgi:hypothetical protein